MSKTTWTASLFRVLVVVVAAAFGCSSTNEESLAALSGACSLTSECQGDLVCIYQRCHQACATSADCPVSQIDATTARCVIGVPPAQNVCLLDDETECNASSECPLGKVCGVDKECRDGCSTANDCIAGQVCSYRTCADPGELGDDGQLPVEDPSVLVGTTCRRNSECTSKLRCLDGTCDRECVGDVDCPPGLVCGADKLCVSPAPPAGCVPATCAELGLNCGLAPDGCGGAIDCRVELTNDGCKDGETCGGAGKPNVCASGSCVAKTSCGEIGGECGLASDGCGAVLSCGICPAAATCGANHRCSCVPLTCAQAAAERGFGVELLCGTVPDGCGGAVDCGTSNCPGACGVGNQCGAAACTPTAVCGDSCGIVSDGCNNVLPNCAGCTYPQTCGGDGTRNVCGCVGIDSCASLGKNCGTVEDGCGHTLECGTCAPGSQCGAVVQNRCGPVQTTFRSCDAASGGPRLSTCGPQLDDDCCRTAAVPGGLVQRQPFDATGTAIPAGPERFDTTIGAFRLDVYEVTIGRFRKYLRAGGPVQGSAVLPGGAAAKFGSWSGWNAAWNGELLPTREALMAALRERVPNPSTDPGTWEGTASAEIENRPLVGATWYEALAFCIWDGGRLPSEAEWLGAALGVGSSPRVFPWGADAGTQRVHDLFIDLGETSTYKTGVGLLSTSVDDAGHAVGDGAYGQRQLYGSVAEWVLDDCNQGDGSCAGGSEGLYTFASVPGCVQDCVYQHPSGYDAGTGYGDHPWHVARGVEAGEYNTTVPTYRGRRFPDRNRTLEQADSGLPTWRDLQDFRVGFRCAR